MIYSDAFSTAVDLVLGLEGGYVDDPADPGGATNFGISQRSYPDLDLITLTEDDAIAIYYRDYWMRAHCNRMPPGVAVCLFDAAVNHGRGKAVRMLQESAGATPDGAIGPRTMAAVTGKDEHALIAEFCARRAVLYAQLSYGRKPYGRFVLGWMRRNTKVCLVATLAAVSSG